LLSSTLVGVLTQRLVRKLCPKCKKKTEISVGVRKKYLISEDVEVYKAQGCSFCQNMGYKGRISLCEYLQALPEMRKLINTSASESEIKKGARRLGMHTLREDGIIKLEKGITTLEEVLKVTSSDEVLKY